MPAEVMTELEFGFHRAFPRDLQVDNTNPALWLRYRIGVRNDEYSDDGVILKELVGWLTLQGQRIGMIKLHEWHVEPGVQDLTFFYATDAASQATADFGSAVLSAWKVAKLASHGPLLELSRVWMHLNFAHKRLWARAVEALIRRHYAGRFSVLLLNTWPADYKAAEARQLDWRGLNRWEYRRSSLGRLARSALHVQPLPAGCPEDDKWWQWRALSDGVPKPRWRKSIFD